jgi:serine/threonine protein kinase
MALPEKLGDWIRGEEIGNGGQGTVFLAHRTEGEPEAVIKVVRVPAGAPNKEKKRKRFIQEVRAHTILARAHASNIIDVIAHNLDEIEGGASIGYIVMPRAYASLQDTSGTFYGRLEISLEAFRGIVNGIAIAHSAGIIHRDIKPENVLFLDKELREPVVCDFGICFIKDTDREHRVTNDNETVGAKWFMSLEQQRGGPIDVTESADVYALGKVLAYMLTGRYMLREETAGVFTAAELAKDGRLSRVRTEILEKPFRKMSL